MNNIIEQGILFGRLCELLYFSAHPENFCHNQSYSSNLGAYRFRQFEWEIHYNDDGSLVITLFRPGVDGPQGFNPCLKYGTFKNKKSFFLSNEIQAAWKDELVEVCKQLSFADVKISGLEEEYDILELLRQISQRIYQQNQWGKKSLNDSLEAILNKYGRSLNGDE